MLILIILVVFFGCFVYDAVTRLSKAPIREIVVYTAIMLVSMVIPILVFAFKVDIPSPTYAIETVLDLIFHIH